MSEERNLRPNFPSGRLLKIELNRAAERLRASHEWQSGDRASASLVKDGPFNVALLMLKKGARLKEHHTKGPLALSVIEGSIRFVAGSGQTTVERGQMVALDKDMPHSVEALEDSELTLITGL